MLSLESNFLVPNATFFLWLLGFFALFLVLVVWPLAESLVRRQWGYAVGVVVFGPIGGLVWFLFGRRETARGTAAA